MYDIQEVSGLLLVFLCTWMCLLGEGKGPIPCYNFRLQLPVSVIPGESGVLAQVTEVPFTHAGLSPQLPALTPAQSWLLQEFGEETNI